MINPIIWTVNRFNDMLWRWQYKRAPKRKLGPFWVKAVRGCLYAVKGVSYD
jgi:hypothetical protein